MLDDGEKEYAARVHRSPNEEHSREQNAENGPAFPVMLVHKCTAVWLIEFNMKRSLVPRRARAPLGFVNPVEVRVLCARTDEVDTNVATGTADMRGVVTRVIGFPNGVPRRLIYLFPRTGLGKERMIAQRACRNAHRGTDDFL